jgi:hypothetical protein
VTDADGQTAGQGISLLVAGTPPPCTGGCSLLAALSGDNLDVTYPSSVPTDCWMPEPGGPTYDDGYPEHYLDHCYLASVALNSAGNSDIDEYGFDNGPGSILALDGQDPSTFDVPIDPEQFQCPDTNCSGDETWLEMWYAPDGNQADWSLISISNAITL